MKREHRPRRNSKDRLMLIAVIVAAFILGGALFINSREEAKAYEKYSEIAQEYAKSNVKEREERIEATRLAEEQAQAEIQKEHEEIQKLAPKVGLDEEDGTLIEEETTSVEINSGRSISIDISGLQNTKGLLVVVCKALNAENGNISLDYEAETVNYNVMTQQCRLYIPIDQESVGDDADIVCRGNIEISNWQLYSIPAAQELTSIKIGTWVIDDHTTTAVEPGSGLNSNKSYTCTNNDNFLYAAQYNQVSIYDISTEEKKLVSTVEGISTPRHMKLSDDGRLLFVTARSNGVYIVDVSDPEDAACINHFDSLELATGLDIEGKYLFICSRYFGIEVYDTSDPQNLKLCSVIRGEKEYQNCCVHDGVLYVAVYNECKIIRYDVSDPYNVRYIDEITPDGKPYAVAVEDGYLYTSIAVSDPSKKNSGYLGYGLSNGFSIYEIADNRSLNKVSTTCLDGRFNAGAFDIYGLKVQDNIVYLSHTYNGIYTFDVTNPKAPVRLSHTYIPIYSYDSQFIENAQNAIWPFNRDVYFQDPILDFSVGKGTIYFVGAYTGTYCVDDASAKYSPKEESTIFVNADSEKAELEIQQSRTAYSADIWDGMDAHAVALDEDHVYVACGNKGIAVYDQFKNRVGTIETEGIVKDICIDNKGRIFAATDTGLFVYGQNGTQYNLLAASECNIRDVEIIADGDRIMAQGDKAYLFELQKDDKNNSFTLTEIYGELFPGTYYRNVMTGLLDGRYCAVQSLKAVKWWDMYGDGTPVDINVKTNLNESQGYAAYGDKCIAIYDGGYVYYDLSMTEVDFRNLAVQRIGETITGKVVVLGEHTLVVTKEFTGEIWIIDISNIDAPRLVDKLSINMSPDIPSGTDDLIYIPVRHSGVIALTKVS